MPGGPPPAESRGRSPLTVIWDEVWHLTASSVGSSRLEDSPKCFASKLAQAWPRQQFREQISKIGVTILLFSCVNDTSSMCFTHSVAGNCIVLLLQSGFRASTSTPITCSLCLKPHVSSTACFIATNSAPKVLDSTVFCLLENQITGVCCE